MIEPAILGAIVAALAPLTVSVIETILTTRERRTVSEMNRIYVSTLQSGIESFAAREGIDLELTQDELREQLVHVEHQRPDLNIAVKPYGGPRNIEVRAE